METIRETGSVVRFSEAKRREEAKTGAWPRTIFRGVKLLITGDQGLRTIN